MRDTRIRTITKLLFPNHDVHMFISVFHFSFFLLSLFAPLNGIQQLEDTSDTQLDQVLSTCLFVPYGHNFCVTQPCRYGVFG